MCGKVLSYMPAFQPYRGKPAGAELELRLAENSVLGGVLPPPACAAAQDINAP